MTAYFVGAFDIHDVAAYDLYRAATVPLLRGIDVEVLTADPNPQVFEGEKPASHVFIVKFGSGAGLENFYRSEGYQAIRHLRTGASDARFLMLMRGADEMET